MLYWFYSNEHYGSHNWPSERRIASIIVHFLDCILLKDKLLPSWWDIEKTNILLKIYTDTHKLFKEKMCWQYKIYNTLSCVSIFKHIMLKCSVTEMDTNYS